MSTKLSILELLKKPENSADATKVESALQDSSFREVDGETYVDIQVATTALHYQWGEWDGDRFNEDYDQRIELDGPHNVDDSRLKLGIPLIDSHNGRSVLGQFGMSEMENGWSVKDQKFIATFKLNEIAKLTGIAGSIKNKTIKFVSMGAQVLKSRWDYTGPRPLRIIELFGPFEVSLVVSGAIPDAMILSNNDNRSLKELLMTIAKKSGEADPTVTPPVPPVVPPVVVEMSAEEVANKALALAGLPAFRSKVVLDAGQKEVSVILEAAQMLGVRKEVDEARLSGLSIEDLHVKLSASAKAHAVRLAAANDATSVSSEIPMPAQKKDAAPVQLRLNNSELIELRAKRRAGTA